MAKQLYDYWFVQFDFPNEDGKPYKSSGGKMVWSEKLKREIPEGWNVVNLIDFAEIKNGATPSTANPLNYGGDIIWITPKDLSDQQSKFVYQGERNISQLGYNSCSTNLLPANSVLLSSRAPIGLVSITKAKLCTNQGFKNLVPHDAKNSLYLYYYIKHHIKQIEQLGTGTTFKEVSREDLCKFPILMPCNTLGYLVWVERMTQIADEQFVLTKEIATLTKQRDELLPLLMNGQVSVNYHLSKSCMRQFVYSYYHSLKNTMKQKFIHSVLQELSKVLDSQQLDFVENTLEQKLLDLDIIEQVTNEELVNQENEELLTAFLSAKKIEGCSAKTIKYYKSTINHLFDETGKTTAEITTNDIRSYLAYYQEKKQSSKVTIDNMRRIFSSFFSWLEDEDYIVKSPVRRIHKVRTDTLVKEVINDECMELLRDNCTEIRDLAMIDLLASTGMRVGELVQMNIGDVDFQERQCKVFGKGNKEREVYFNARAKIHLQQYISQREDNNPALFVSFSSPHKRLSISGVEVRLRTLGRRINLPKIHPHKFRRTLATMAIDKGMPIEQVQRLLGHVKIDTTLHYAMVNQNNVKIAHRRYIG